MKSDHTGNGSPRNFARPIQAKVFGTSLTPKPLVMRSAIPRKTVSVPSVTMIGETLMRQTMSPFRSPKVIPRRIPAIQANGAGSCLASKAAETAQIAYCDPIERSIFPLMMRNAVPRHAMPVKET